MKFVNNIQLNIIQEISEYKQTLCEMVIDHKPSNILIRGKILERAVSVDENRYVIFTTDEVIFEESLNIYLIELGKGVVDQLFIGQAYQTDIFSGLKIVNESSLSFSFLGSWTLEVYAKAKFGIGINSEVLCLYNLKLKHYLKLSCVE
ncbi:hypothetical protein [Acinetobacter sp. P8-3-8]|uniref:hypothetical protein n=1 Tax=Acinetobacter sp. P8-3-8 TaxID=1029823 RepID=UPI000248591D|nr:hypothetical protein [Acinetobacter sp. P8-3-8]